MTLLAAAYHIGEAMAAIGDDYPATIAKLEGIADYLESCAGHDAATVTNIPNHGVFKS